MSESQNENQTTTGSGEETEIGGWPAVERRDMAVTFNGWSAPGEWANTVTVEPTAAYDPTIDQNAADDTEWADGGGRHLVEIDTNYKASRPGQHPVMLTRADAARLAAAVLRAIEDTFHYRRVGRLRPTEAAELLRELEGVEADLAELRSHALADLIAATIPDPDETADDLTQPEQNPEQER